MVEKFGLDPQTQKALKEMGYQLKINGSWSNAQLIVLKKISNSESKDETLLSGASDIRGVGSVGVSQ